MNNKIICGNKSYDVITWEQLQNNPELYSYIDAAVQDGDYVYPIRSKTDTRPGIYDRGPFYGIVRPETDSEKEMYSVDRVIDFENQTSLGGVIRQQNALRDQERMILTTPDNIYIPQKLQSDSQAMKGLKEAVTRKHIDLDKYESRFGNNYANDKRILTSDTITLSKLITMANALDMSLTLSIGDKAPDVPNPINGEIVVDLLGDDMTIIPKKAEDADEAG